MARLVRFRLLPLLLCLSAFALQAQRYQLKFVPGTPAGEQIELIQQYQIDTLRKIALMDRFLKNFPNHEAAAYFLEWMQAYYLRGGQPDWVLHLGERLLVLHPEDLDAALRCQQAAAMKKDSALMNLWDGRVMATAERIAVMKQPAGLDGEIWKQSLEHAKGMLADREYKEYKAAFDASNARLKAQLFEDFLRKYPKSEYGPRTWPQIMNLYRSLGDSDRAVDAAQKVLTRDEDDPDALLLVAQVLLERRTGHARIIAGANRVLQTIPDRPKPESYRPEEWEQRKNYYIGTAHLQIGNAYVNQNNFALADKELRASLPFLKGNEQTEAAVLFYLGWANYQMENYGEAASFFRQCVGLAKAGAFAEQAARNLTALKNERRIPE